MSDTKPDQISGRPRRHLCLNVMSNTAHLSLGRVALRRAATGFFRELQIRKQLGQLVEPSADGNNAWAVISQNKHIVKYLSKIASFSPAIGGQIAMSYGIVYRRVAMSRLQDLGAQ